MRGSMPYHDEIGRISRAEASIGRLAYFAPEFAVDGHTTIAILPAIGRAFCLCIFDAIMHFFWLLMSMAG
jgi:hypothetical protein